VLQRVLLFQLVINGVVIGAVLVFFVAYIRRQRRRLREVEALLREYAD
jgi:preprotein translocase subunit YajC